MEPSTPVAFISNLSKALSEQIRVRMLICLQGGPLSLQHFADIIGLAPSTLSKHLHILESAGLLVSTREGRWRLYQWPGETSGSAVSSLLAWLREAASGDPVLQADAAKRAVAIQKNTAPAPKGDQTRVLFLCTGNSCRSQMAEALLREKGGRRFAVSSAGVAPREIPPLTVEIMAEIGIDIRDQKPKSVMEFIGAKYFDYLITVCPMAEKHTPVFPGVTRRIHWPVKDPAEATGTDEQKKEVFRQVRDQISDRIDKWLEEQAPAYHQ